MQGSVPGLGRFPGEVSGNPFQYSCLGNPIDREAWWATVLEVAKSWQWSIQICSMSIYVFCDIVQEIGIKTIPSKKKRKKAKCLSEEALQIAVKRKEVKRKG